MSRLLTLGRGGVIDADRIIALASARSTPVRRLLAYMLQTTPERVINLTYGYPRETIIMLEDGYLIVVSQTINRLTEVLGSERIDDHEQSLIQRPG